ncbi:MAG: flagellar export protein FliJ [Candidatus Hydrogenedentes bacterium]|nr:flagellar export protein FliJ [Candidatus Hydrogenedentota bacterium]
MPKPWQKYAVLLRVRERQERLKAQALAAARRDVGRAQAQRDALAEEQQRVLVEAGNAAKRNVDAAKVQAFIHYERHIARLAVDKDAEIYSLKSTAEKRRAELEEAMKRRRVVERLNERERLAYRNHVLKEEQKLLDETASVQAALERRADRA